MVVAGALENVDLARFRGGQLRKVLNDAIHPKWEKMTLLLVTMMWGCLFWIRLVFCQYRSNRIYLMIMFITAIDFLR